MLHNFRRALSNMSLIRAKTVGDRFLILDVAAYKYPPTWVKTKELWNGINSLDQTSNRSRGLITVRG